MAAYLDIDGVNTWTETRGSGEQTVVLLHGGLGNSDQLFDAIGSGFEPGYRVVGFDRRGHGYTADTEEPFHYDDMATHAIKVLERLDASKAHLVGWSDGGIVAMLVALRRPDLVDRLVLIGTNIHFEGLVELDLGGDSPVGDAMLEAYAARSPDGADHFPVVAEKYLAMVTTEPDMATADLARLEHPTLLLVGDDDLVRLDHTVALYHALPAGRLCVVPGASHAVVIEHPQLVSTIIRDFLQGPEPPETFLPVRRAR